MKLCPRGRGSRPTTCSRSYEPPSQAIQHDSPACRSTALHGHAEGSGRFAGHEHQSFRAASTARSEGGPLREARADPAHRARALGPAQRSAPRRPSFGCAAQVVAEPLAEVFLARLREQLCGLASPVAATLPFLSRGCGAGRVRMACSGTCRPLPPEPGTAAGARRRRQGFGLAPVGHGVVLIRARGIGPGGTQMSAIGAFVGVRWGRNA